MSSYIVENKTIDRIISFIDHNQRELSFLPGWRKEQYFSEEELAGLGQKMIEMNVAAFQTRYPQFEKKIDTKKYIYHCMLETRYQYLQSLRCFLYQCCEGDILKSDLYTSLQRLEHFMISRILADMPEMQKTEWG